MNLYAQHFTLGRSPKLFSIESNNAQEMKYPCNKHSLNKCNVEQESELAFHHKNQIRLKISISLKLWFRNALVTE